MRKDMDIQHDISQELAWEPGVQNDDIAVAVRDGVVTLAGFAPTYVDKVAAERVASRIKGVKGVANDIQITLPAPFQRSDPELARAAVNALAWHAAIPRDAITVKVENGWIRLEGSVEWFYQKEIAEKAVRVLIGVKGVSNMIAVKERPAMSDIKQKIGAALHRTAAFDAERVGVEVHGHTVTLRGTVRSFAERRDIERAARNAPGVMLVENELAVDPQVFAII